MGTIELFTDAIVFHATNAIHIARLIRIGSTWRERWALAQVTWRLMHMSPDDAEATLDAIERTRR